MLTLPRVLRLFLPLLVAIEIFLANFLTFFERDEKSRKLENRKNRAEETGVEKFFVSLLHIWTREECRRIFTHPCAAAKLTAEDTDEMDNTHTVVRAAYAARVEDDENC